MKPTKPQLSRNARRAIDQRHAILELLKRLTPETIEDLDRRARLLPTPDGYPTGTGTGRGSDIARPVEHAAIALVEGDQTADPIGTQIRLVLGALAEAAGVLAPADRWLRHLAAYGDQAATPNGDRSGDCKCCDRVVTGTPNDRLRAGYCDACRMAYTRWTETNPIDNDPGAHRLEFEQARRHTLAKRGEPDDTTATDPCPHRCCQVEAAHDHWRGPNDCTRCRAIEAGIQAAS